MEDYYLIDKPSVMVIGIECRTSNQDGRAVQDLGQLWHRLYREEVLIKIPNPISDEIIALYCDYEGDFTQPYSCVIGRVVASLEMIPDGMVGKVIPAATFAVFRAVGAFPESLVATWQKIWGANLQRTYSGDYELYGQRFHTGSPKEAEVFIAVGKES